MSLSSLTLEHAEELIRRLTDGLVTLVDETGTLTVTTPDGKTINQKEWKAWDWNQGVALTTLYNHSSTDPSSAAAKYSLNTCLEWFEYQYEATGGKGAPKNINTMAPLYCLSSMLLDGRVNDQRWRSWCDEWAEWVMDGLPRTREGGFQHTVYRKVNKDQLWDDTLMMTVVPLARIGILFDRPRYIEEVKYQCLLHIQYLMDTESGLWFHGWQFTDDGCGHNFARALWARGNAWITYSIPLLLEILGDRLASNDPTRRILISAFTRQVEALIKLQDKASGLWHTLLDDPTSYLEVSGTAGFAAGIFMGIRTRLLDRTTYLPAARRALAAVVANIREDGQVNNVSYGTPMGDTLDFYKQIPITPMPYGQALTMAALVEWSRLLEESR